MTQPLEAAFGIVLDQLLGEPSTAVHPVVHFGAAMNAFESKNYRDHRVAGAAHALVGLVLGGAVGRLLGSTTLTTGLAVGGRSLRGAATEVHRALVADDIERARTLLPSLVGRDHWCLDHNEIARAVVESVAENTTDAVVGPVLWAVVAGAMGAFCYRAVNTMDAMVGHRSSHYGNYGWASARLDDLANWIPARCTALLVMLVRPGAIRAIHRAVKTQAPHHPSPNAGVTEAAFAAAMDVRLGGQSTYGGAVEVRPQLGTGRSVAPDDIPEAIRLSRDVTFALAVLLGALGMVKRKRQRWG